MDLVDDHGASGRQHRAAGLRAEQDVERFRRGHHDVRGAAAHAVALAGGSVAGADPGADVHVRQALRLEALADAGERCFQVALDVVRQGLEGGDVDDLGFVLEAAVEPLPHQAVDGGEKGRERLSRSGRGRNQHVPAGLEGGPSARLRRRGRSKAALKPGGNGRMKQGTWRHGTAISGRMISLRRRPQRRRARLARISSATYGFLASRINPPHGKQPSASAAGAPPIRGRCPRGSRRGRKTISSSPAW